jgi:hypothetical protein
MYSSVSVSTRRGSDVGVERVLIKTRRFLLMAGGALLIVGFAKAADEGFNSPSAYGVITGGGVGIALAIVNCLYTKRRAIIPAVCRRFTGTLRQQKDKDKAATLIGCLFRCVYSACSRSEPHCSSSSARSSRRQRSYLRTTFSRRCSRACKAPTL